MLPLLLLSPELRGPWRSSTINYLRHLKNRHNLLFAELMGVQSSEPYQEEMPGNSANLEETPIKTEAQTKDSVCKVEKEKEFVVEGDPVSDNEPSSVEPKPKLMLDYFTRVDDNTATCNTRPNTAT